MESLLLFDISISAKLMARTSCPKIKKACARIGLWSDVSITTCKE